MIRFTDKAIAAIKHMLQEDNQQDHGIRIGARGEGKCAMNFYIGIQRAPLPDDKVFQWKGITVMMDQMSVGRMLNIELDFIETPHGSGFVFRNRSEVNDKDKSSIAE